MNLITTGDIIDLYLKIHERGLRFILDKFTLSSGKRIYNTWKNTNIGSSNWWVINAVQKRWNEKITGNPEYEYEDYVIEKYLHDSRDITLLSVGCGSGSHEIKFAGTGAFKSILGLDIATGPINYATNAAKNQKLNNVTFIESSFEEFKSTAKFDVILFHSSLHHFQNISTTLDKANSLLNKNGLIVVHEYVGPDRLQFTKERIRTMNEVLKKIPKHLKKTRASYWYKKKVYRPGLLRMILADPSEACSSSKITGILNEKFDCLEQKILGGDILHLLLKDIAHNFTTETTDVITIMKYLFDFEDAYLQSKDRSDFMFGVFKKKPGSIEKSI